MPESKFFSVVVGDVFRLAAWGGGYRVWKVTEVNIGMEEQESVVRLDVLDMKESVAGSLVVPIQLLAAANCERV